MDDYEEPVWKKLNTEKPSVFYSRGANQKRSFLNFCNEKCDDLLEEKKRKQAVLCEKKVKKKRTLEDIFEQSFIYQDLQKIRDIPLNIEQVDYRGNSVKRYEYYFDFEESKHNLVEIEEQNVVQENVLNSSTINKRSISKFNRSSFDLSIIERDKSFLTSKLNRCLISCQANNYSSNLNRLYTSFNETKNVTLTSLQTLNDRDKILKFCKPNYTTKFENILNVSKQIEKLAEGSFGEIYKYLNDDTILKVIKVQEDDLDQLLAEVLVSFTLNEMQNKSQIDNFIRIERCCLVEDRYSSHLLKAWQSYNEQVKMSQNEDPSNYDQNTLFIVLFLEDGGHNLETFLDGDNELEPNAAQCLSIFQQVLLSLAIAECSIQFEHRDLHLGNILVKRTKEREIRYKLKNGKCYKVQTNGIKIKIIDFSLARFSTNKVTVFQNLNECPEIFDGRGDHQYNVYRKMRKVSNCDWSAFNALTNIFWLEYLAVKLDAMLVGGNRGKRRDSEEKKLVSRLRRWKSHLKQYESCCAALELLDL